MIFGGLACDCEIGKCLTLSPTFGNFAPVTNKAAFSVTLMAFMVLVSATAANLREIAAQQTDTVTDYLVNRVAYLAAKEQNIFLRRF